MTAQMTVCARHHRRRLRLAWQRPTNRHRSPDPRAAIRAEENRQQIRRRSVACRNTDRPHRAIRLSGPTQVAGRKSWLVNVTECAEKGRPSTSSHTSDVRGPRKGCQASSPALPRPSRRQASLPRALCESVLCSFRPSREGHDLGVNPWLRGLSVQALMQARCGPWAW
jgi:hypothetical protein